MRRLHLFEFEDQDWFPAFMRDHMTDVLRMSVIGMRLHEPLVGKLSQALERARTSRIVDLCSGGGGILPAIHQELRRADDAVSVLFTDRYPNRAALAQLCAQDPKHRAFCRHAVDATRVPSELRGLRTLFSGFHHFAPEHAKRILADAVLQRESIGIFEFSERALWSLLRVSLAPVGVWATTPLIRPVDWRRLAFTYLFPAIPLCLLWDGWVSALRTYSCAELLALAQSVGGPDYDWEVGKLQAPFDYRISYLIGHPRWDVG